MLEGTVAFTGRLASMKRADAFALVRKHGGKLREGVTRKTDVLVVGELGWPLLDDGRPSNSLAQAKTHGIPVASERQFLEWLGQSVRPPLGAWPSLNWPALCASLKSLNWWTFL
jgi:NAD-dependent DNA ligase